MPLALPCSDHPAHAATRVYPARGRMFFGVFLAGAIVAGLLLSSGCASVPAPAKVTVRATPSQPGSVVPARIVANFFLVESRQDDGQVRTFLVDTGSTATLVSAEFADSLDRRPLPDRARSASAVRVRRRIRG